VQCSKQSRSRRICRQLNTGGWRMSGSVVWWMTSPQLTANSSPSNRSIDVCVRTDRALDRPIRTYTGPDRTDGRRSSDETVDRVLVQRICSHLARFNWKLLGYLNGHGSPSSTVNIKLEICQNRVVRNTTWRSHFRTFPSNYCVELDQSIYSSITKVLSKAAKLFKR